MFIADPKSGFLSIPDPGFRGRKSAGSGSATQDIQLWCGSECSAARRNRLFTLISDAAESNRILVRLLYVPYPTIWLRNTLNFITDYGTGTGTVPVAVSMVLPISVRKYGRYRT
jgi:hypothetical protein